MRVDRTKPPATTAAEPPGPVDLRRLGQQLLAARDAAQAQLAPGVRAAYERVAAALRNARTPG